jgi:hypothetical protein
MKSKPFEYYQTINWPQNRSRWVVHSTIDYDNPKLGHFRAVVGTRKVARELIQMIKAKYPAGKQGVPPSN